MCGRFSLSAPPEALVRAFALEGCPPLTPRYNVAPTQAVAAVVPAEGGGRALRWFRWGLIPHWAQAPSLGARLINARAETVASKPSFREALRRRRCLIPADGFFEWQATAHGKQPIHFRRPDGAVFAFAGLWARWTGPEGTIESCAVLTTRANARVRPYHPRMPVILDPEDYALWLDRAVEDPEPLCARLRPCPEDALIAYPVSAVVNDPRHDAPECVAPLAPR